MKALLVCVVIGLLGVNGWLAMNQHQLKQKVAVLEGANRDLSEAVERKPDIPVEELRQTRTQLEQAQMTLAATEKMITNLVPAGYQNGFAATDSFAPASQSSAKFAAPKPVAVPGVPAAVDAFSQPATRIEQFVVSSSHTPDGQLQKRSWGPEQMVGPPNTTQAGDLITRLRGRRERPRVRVKNGFTLATTTLLNWRR